MVGIMIPFTPGLPARLSISFTDSSTPWVIGTRATPARRGGLVAQNSTSQRLWARAPAHARRESVIMPALRPAPNGGDSIPVTASPSAKMISPATPSASRVLSRISQS